MGLLAKDVMALHGADPSAKVAFISSGLLDEFLSAVTTFRKAGEPGLTDTDHFVLTYAIASLTLCVGEPEVDAKLYDAAPALEYCLDHSFDVIQELGATSGAYSSELCAKLFGRLEVGSGFSFKQEHVDDLCAATLVARLRADHERLAWSSRSDRMCTQVGQVVAGDTRRGILGHPGPLGGHDLHSGALCVRRKRAFFASVHRIASPKDYNSRARVWHRSDANKLLLLANPDFLAYLTDGLLLDHRHPRAESLTDDAKAWLQSTHAESFAQLAVFEPGRDALRQDPSVSEALQEVVDRGLSEQSRELASQALMAMSDAELQADTGGQMHIMLSCKYTSSPPVACDS